MSKSEVYSWRMSPALKSALEQAARAEQISLARLLERIAQEWLQQEFPDDDDELQRRLHEAAAKTIGTIQGGDPYRAEQARERIRAKLRQHHESSRPD